MGADFWNPKIKSLCVCVLNLEWLHTSTGEGNGNIEWQEQVQDCNDFQKYFSN